MALPRPSPRVVFRPTRRVSWAMRIFAGLVFALAVVAVGYFLAIVLPARVATLARTESTELAAARQGAASVRSSLTVLWNDMGARGGMSLPDDRLAQDLALAQTTERAAEAALGHVQAAQANLAQADGVPFQFHHPAFVVSDQPGLRHLDKSLQAAIKLAHGATLQLTLAGHTLQDWHTVTNQLNVSLAAKDWTQVATVAASLQRDLKGQSDAAINPEALLDPLWAKWIDAMAAYASTAQQFSLASAARQTQTAQQLARALSAASDQMGAAVVAAQAGAAAWQQKTVQPLIDTVASELAAAS